jgi:alanine racemase
MYERPVWTEIDLSAIAHNVRQIKSLLSINTQLCAVVKADAYGHGAVPVAKTVLEAGADYLAVAILSEGIELRRAGITAPILILGYTPDLQASMVVKNGLSQTVFSWEMAKALSDAAIFSGVKSKVHLKIDTGMSRIGILPQDAADFAARVAVLPNLEIEGVYTHFATADSSSKIFCRKQFACFQEVLESINERAVHIAIRHCANSAATIDLPETHLDMVRAGIVLYGLLPSTEIEKKIELLPAMKFKAKVAYVKELPSGIPISYGCTYITSCPKRIVTLPVGYADGWSRLLSNKGKVLIQGSRAPLVGRICMDQCMADVTDIPNVSLGDEVLLFGGQDLSVEEVAKELGTINYEVVCMVGKRVPRFYPMT